MSVTEIDGANAIRFATTVGVTDAQMADFYTYQKMLADWSRRTNLVGPSALREFWVRHALDSAQLFHVERQAIRWADVGSGAGFPGVPLAILLKSTPGAEVHLIESIGKRVNFLHSVAEGLRLPVRVHHQRAEEIEPSLSVEVVTARACAPLTRLFDFTRSMFRNGARGLFLKGRNVMEEIGEAEKSWRFQHQLLPSLSDPSGRLLRISKVSPRVGG